MARAVTYAGREGLVVGNALGRGVHGIVVKAFSQSGTGSSAIKVHEREFTYVCERDVYLRLEMNGVKEVLGHHVPQLIDFDDKLWLIRMTIVSRPFVLDFAGAYLDSPPDYPEEVLTQWRQEKREQFEDKWPKVQAVLRGLQRYGVYMADVNPGNVGFVIED